MTESLRIAVTTKDGQPIGHGTAWALFPELVVTAFHVVGNTATRLWKHEDPLRRGCKYILPGISTEPLEPLRYDPCADVAILRLSKSAKLGDSCFLVPSPSPPMPGDVWYAEGYPDLPGLRPERGVGLGGVVQRASTEITSNALQLQVRQGTAATWEGISGSAVRNHNDEVIGIVTQTSKDVATAHAAPVEAVERLLRFPEGDALAGRVLSALRTAGDEVELAANVAESMGWTILDLSLDGLVFRAAMEGADGLSDLLVMAEKDRGAPILAAAELREAMAEASRGDALESEILRVLQAILPDEPDRDEAVVDRVGAALPTRVVKNALDTIVERTWAERRRDGTIALTARGARRAARREHVLAVLRALRGGERLSRAALESRLSRVPPVALRRALGCAIRAGWVEAQPGDFVRETKAGGELVSAADDKVFPWPS